MLFLALSIGFQGGRAPVSRVGRTSSLKNLLGERKGVKTNGTVALRRDTDKTHRKHPKKSFKASGGSLDGKTLRRPFEGFKIRKTILVQSNDERESLLKSEGDP